MRTLFVSACILAALGGCDRRDDPDVPPESKEVINPPGDAVGSTDGTMAPQHPPESTLEPTTPAEVPAHCDGLTGGQLAQCVREGAGEEVESTPTPKPSDG